MKKFLAVLLAVAMVMSLLPTIAFADEGQSYLQINGIAGSSDRTENQLNIIAPIAANDVVIIDFRPVGEQTYGSGIFDVRTHDGGTKLFYAQPDDDGWNVHEQSANAGTVAMDTVSFVDLGDGWYRASFKVTVAQADGLHMAFGYATVEIDNLKIGDKVCSFNEANVVELAEENAASLKFDDETEFDIEQSVNGFDWVASLVEIAPPAPSYLQIKAKEDFPSRPEHQLKVTAPIAAGESVTFDFRPVIADGVGNDGGIFDVRSFTGTKLFYAKPSSSTPGTWSVNEQSANAGTVDMTTVSITALEDGWYRATFKMTSAQDGFYVALGYYTVEIDNLKVGDKVCSFNEANIAELAEKNAASLKFDDGTEFSIARASNGFDWVAALAPVEEEEAVIWHGYIMPAKSSNRNTIFVESTFTTGDVVGFLVFIGESSDVDNTDMYVRKSAKALYLGTNEEVYSGNHIVDFALPLLNDGEETGWYYIECVLQEDSTKLEFSVDGANVSDGNLGQNLITYITVNGELLDDTVVVTDNSGNPVTPEELDATGVELPEREALQLIVTGEGATVVVKDYEGTEVEPGEEALTEKYEYTIDVEVDEGYELLGILVNGEEFENGDSFIAAESVEITVSTLQKFEADITAENATVVIKDAEGNTIEGIIEAGTEVTIEVEVAEGFELVSVTVNGEAYEVGDTIIVTDGLVVEVVTAEETAEIEPTGAISAAVVAVMAVLGGAVVLKKKEF